MSPSFPTLLFSLLGFPLGLVLSFIAPEELKPAKKYFLFLTLLFSFLTPAALLLSLFNRQLFLLLPASIFLLGLPAGTLLRLKLIEKEEASYQPKSSHAPQRK